MTQRSEPVVIRPAVPADSMEIARLVLLAIEDLAELYTGTTEEQSILHVLSDYAQMEVCRFSYRNVLLAELDGQVAGGVLSYPADQLDALDAPLYAHLQKTQPAAKVPVECEGRELYLDSLAVYPHYRGHGLGGHLVRSVLERAQDLDYPRVSLLVDREKPRVRAMYERLGFVPQRTYSLQGHPYDRMVHVL